MAGDAARFPSALATARLRPTKRNRSLGKPVSTGTAGIVRLAYLQHKGIRLVTGATCRESCLVWQEVSGSGALRHEVRKPRRIWGTCNSKAVAQVVPEENTWLVAGFQRP